MDISKASNFERFVFDLVGRDAARVRELLAASSTRRASSTCPAEYGACATGFVSGRSTHADRLATIRAVHSKYGVMIDPHTADGVKVASSTASRACRSSAWRPRCRSKFAETIREALGREPRAPGGARGPRAAAAALRGDRARRRGRQAAIIASHDES